jgi:hypothetical protein
MKKFRVLLVSFSLLLIQSQSVFAQTTIPSPNSSPPPQFNTGGNYGIQGSFNPSFGNSNGSSCGTSIGLELGYGNTKSG